MALSSRTTRVAYLSIGLATASYMSLALWSGNNDWLLAPAPQETHSKLAMHDHPSVVTTERQFEGPPAHVLQTIQRAQERWASCCDKDDYLLMLLMSEDAVTSRANASINSELCESLPTLQQVAHMYGPRPVILGLETCRDYRSRLGNNQAKPRVAGLYHTATNALARSLQTNLERIGSIGPVDGYNVPWGKHLLPNKYRLTNLHPKHRPPENVTAILPIVIVRDVFFWMQAMCKAPYDAHWVRRTDQRCPNLWSTRTHAPNPVYTLTHQTNYTQLDRYPSMVEFWNRWNMEYLEADFPRLMVRFEDIVYRLPSVVSAIRDCIGVSPGRMAMSSTNASQAATEGSVRNHFVYHTSSSKKHGSPAGVLESLPKYASMDQRHVGLTEQDRAFANRMLDPELMRLFQYQWAPSKPSPSDLKGPFPELGKPPGPVPDIEELRHAED